MQQEALLWMCHVPASLYGSRKHLWQEGRVFRKIKIQRLDELTAKVKQRFHQRLSIRKEAARVENSPGQI